MKMKYETPSAEKISFNYRDQIVAASPGGTTDDSTDSSYNVIGIDTTVCGIVGRTFDYLGSSICD